jgi:hypothetical protein
MMGTRQKLNADGWDAFSRRSRRMLRWKPGRLAYIKRRFAKLARREAKKELTQKGEEVASTRLLEVGTD